MSHDDYMSIDAVNWSTLKEMRRSPLHYRHRLANARPDTTALSLGRHIHCAVFEPERFDHEFTVEPDFGDCRKTDRTTSEDARKNKLRRNEWRVAHAGKKLLTALEFSRAVGVRDAVRAHPEAVRYLERGIAEHTLTWMHAPTGLACKGRLDWISHSCPAIVDLKSAADIAIESLSRAMYRYGHHSQLAFYSDGWLATHDEQLPSVIIACESAPPHDVGVFRIDPEAIEIGQAEYAELLERLAVARTLKRWPGQYPLEMTLGLPAWARGDDEDLTETDIDWSAVANG